MDDDMRDPKYTEPAGEPASWADPSQPAEGPLPAAPQPPQESSLPQQPVFDSEDLLPRDADEDLRGQSEPRRHASTGGLIERLTGALRQVTHPLRETGHPRDTGRPGRTGSLSHPNSLGRTGVLRGEPGEGALDDARPGVTGDLRSVEPPASGGTNILPNLPSEEPALTAPQSEEDKPRSTQKPRLDADEVPDLRMSQLGNESDGTRPEQLRGTGSLIERLTGTLRQTTGNLRRTGPLSGRGLEVERQPGEGLPGSECVQRQRAARTLRPSPEAYVPELRQSLASEEEQLSGRPNSGLLRRITGTLRKVTGPLRRVTGSLRGTGQLRGEAPTGETAETSEALFSSDPGILPAVEIPDTEPEIADDFLADRLGTSPLVETGDMPPAYSTGWEDISVPAASDIDITSEMLGETGETNLFSESEEPTLVGDEPISLLDSGAIAALDHAEGAEREAYLPDWMAEIRQEAAAEDAPRPQTPFSTGAEAPNQTDERKPGKKGLTGQLMGFIAGIFGRSEGKRPSTGELPDDLVTGRLQRSMTTTDLDHAAPAGHVVAVQSGPAELTPTAPEEDFLLPEDRFTFGESAGPAAVEDSAEAEAGFDFGVAPEVEDGELNGFSFDQPYEEAVNPLRPLELDTEPTEEPLGGDRGSSEKPRSTEAFEADLGEEGPLAARFEMFRERRPEDRVQPPEEAPTIDPLVARPLPDEEAAQPAAFDAFAPADFTVEIGDTAGADDSVGTDQVVEEGPFAGPNEAAQTPNSFDEEYKLSPEEEALLWGRTNRLQTKDLSSEDEPPMEEVWSPSPAGRRPAVPIDELPLELRDEEDGPAPDPEKPTNPRDLSLEERVARTRIPTGGLFLPVSDEEYAAAYLAGIELPGQLAEAPKEDMLRKALAQAEEAEEEEEVVSVQDLRTIALEGYQEISAPRASLVEETPLQVETETEDTAVTEAETDLTEEEIAFLADLAPDRGFRPWLNQRTVVEKVLLVEAALVALAMMVAVPFFVYTIIRGASHRVNNAQVSSLSPRPLPADVPTPTGLVLPGGWYFSLNKSTFVQGSWKPARSEWLEGTELRRVIALPWNPQTEAVIQTFKQGDRVKLDLSNGKSLVYKISEVKRVPVTDTSIMTDNRPTMVVILYKENAQERWVVFCKP